MKNEPEQSRKEQTIQIGLPERHWVVLLALLDDSLRRTILPAIKKPLEQGKTLDQIDDVQTTALVGPLMIRGVIVKELAARGIMTPEADQQFGIDALLKHAEQFKKRMADKG